MIPAAAAPHNPVMIDNVLAALAPRDGDIHVDGTFGAGDYSRAILAAADCRVVAIDRDKTALARGRDLEQSFPGRLVLLHGRFGDAAALLAAAGYDRVDGFVLDVGVSSMQLDQPERGFSFRHDAPLDMRVDQAGDDETAADLVNRLPEQDLANLIYRYGEERHSRRIARRIAEHRAQSPIATTGRLADIVRGAVPRSPRDLIDPATRTFQALRIAVNDKLGELERALAAAERLLGENGRLVVVSFHSLEDSIVKSFLRDRSGRLGHGSRYLPQRDDAPASTFTLPVTKAVKPSPDEVAANPRARSARLRLAIRTNAPPRDIALPATDAKGGRTWH